MGWFRRNSGEKRRRSAHWYRTYTRDGHVEFRCGHRLLVSETEQSDDLPLTWKSCESCLRLKQWDESRQGAENAEVTE